MHVMIAEQPDPIFSRFQRLVAGVRPSVGWIIGLDGPGADLLDIDGRSGWQVACRQLQTELETFDDDFVGADRSAAKALQRWLRYDESLEAARWETPQLLMEHFAAVAFVTVDGEAMFNKDMFIETWTRNFRCAAASYDGRPWHMPNNLSASVSLIVGELAGDKTAAELTSLLFELACAAFASGGQAGPQLIGPGFRPELTSVLRHSRTAPTRTSSR